MVITARPRRGILVAGSALTCSLIWGRRATGALYLSEQTAILPALQGWRWLCCGTVRIPGIVKAVLALHLAAV